MKFVMSITKLSDSELSVPFTVPCSGYFQNIQIKMLSLGDNEWSIGFGKVSMNQFKNELIPASGSFALVKSRRSSDYLRFDWTDVEPDPSQGAEGDWIYVGFSSKRLYVKSDEIYQLAFTSTASASLYLFLQAEFVPHPNAFYKQSWSMNALAEDSNYNKSLIIPQALKNAVLTVHGHVDTQTGEHGVLMVRIADRDDPDIDDTLFEGGYGTMGRLATAGGTTPTNGIYLLDIGDPNSNTGANTQIRQSWPVTKIIHEGDAITFDIVQDAGTLTAGDIDAIVTLEGIAFQKNSSKLRSQFAEGASLVQLRSGGGDA